MSKNEKTNRWIKEKLVMMSFAIASIVTLTGCLTSPYYSQEFYARTDEIPFQFWTTDKDQDVTLECGKASAGGGRLLMGQEYHPLATITPSCQPHYDFRSGDTFIYQASRKIVIPDHCWRYYNYRSGAKHITTVRITQGSHGDKAVYTFVKMVSAA